MDKGGPKIPVAVFDDRTLSLKLNKKQLKPRLHDGTKIESFEIVKVKKRIFLLRSGLDEEGNCHLVRNELEFTPDGALMLRVGTGGGGASVAYSCTGAPCSSCKFTDDGLGCECRPGKGKRCNHTIVSGRIATDIFIA